MQQREAWDDDIFINENQPMDGTRRSVVFLPPGSTMYVYPNSCSLQQLIAILKRSIMPPGLAHEVFTPIASVMIGSHFLTYDTMPATELSMRLEKEDTRFKTNKDHPAILTMVAQMAAALPVMEGSEYPLSSVVCKF